MKMKFEADKLGALVEGSIEPLQGIPGGTPETPAAPAAPPPRPPGPPTLPSGRPLPPRPGNMQQPGTQAPRPRGRSVEVHVKVDHRFSASGATAVVEILPGSPVGQIGECFMHGLPLAPFVPAETGRRYVITITELPESAPQPKPNPWKKGSFA